MKTGFNPFRFGRDSNSSQELDTRLRQTAPQYSQPATLHRDIMCAIRSAKPETSSRFRSFGWQQFHWAMPAATCSLVLLVAAGWFAHARNNSRQRSFPPGTGVDAMLASAERALQAGVRLPQSATSVLSPMAEELELVNLDFRKTAEHVLASLP